MVLPIRFEGPCPEILQTNNKKHSKGAGSPRYNNTVVGHPWGRQPWGFKGITENYLPSLCDRDLFTHDLRLFSTTFSPTPKFLSSTMMVPALI